MASINVALLIGSKKKTIMACIEFHNACVDFPIYNASSRSLKKQLIQVATGGKLSANDQGRVIVRALEDLTFSSMTETGLDCSVITALAKAHYSDC